MYKFLKRFTCILMAAALLLGLFPAALAAEDMPELSLPNGDFESGNASNWVLTGLPASPVRQDEWNTSNLSWTLNLWTSNDAPVEIHASYPVKLTAGSYKFSFLVTGLETDSQLRWSVKAGDQLLAQQAGSVTTTGYKNWLTVETDEFTLSEAAEVVFDFGGTGPQGYWGDLDELKLFGTGELWTEPEQPQEMAQIPLPNSGFDNGTTGWELQGLPGEVIENGSSSSHYNVLNLWASDDAQAAISAAYPVRLTAGVYQFRFDVDGPDLDSNLHYAVKAGEEYLFLSQDTVVTTGWDEWATLETGEFTLDADTEISFVLFGTGPVGYWGHLDNLKLFGTGAIAPSAVEFAHTPTVALERVKGVDSEDFIRGTDVSSYLSVVRSGAKFYDYEGNLLDDQGFFNLLASAGFNYIRLRIWNDPYDAQGNGYGGGNNDVEAALLMGQWASNAGMKVLIDFHYSDFWADPGKQFAPKAWANYSVAQKAAAIDAFTYESLSYLINNGVDVGMVQVGNETTAKICGEGSWSNMAQLFNAGSAAVRRVAQEQSKEIRVAIHFTNPEKSSAFAGLAANLNNYNVDYDVLGTSWYPYWHGSTDNLTAVLKNVADSYGKQVMVAETSWAWTLEDGDGWDNTVSPSGNSTNMPYAFSLQGQANELAAAAKAVTAVGEKGLGVFYWENAWIPVQYAYDEAGNLDESILASNRQKWEQFGSGWAASYASDYQEDAREWHGGSAVDNQAMFDFHGKALDSLWSWTYMMAGTLDAVPEQVESVQNPELTYEAGDTLVPPETVQVYYLRSGVVNEPVSWNQEELAAVDMNTPGVYTVSGLVDTQVGQLEAKLTVTVTYPNLLRNPGFEESSLDMYSVHSGGSRTTQDVRSGSYSFHFYNVNGGTVELAQEISLEPGEYSFSLYVQGEQKDVDGQYISVRIGDKLLTQDFSLAGWNNWQHPSIHFTVPKTSTVTVGAYLPYGPGGWGAFDDLSLVKTQELEGVVLIDDISLNTSISLNSGLTITGRLSLDDAFNAYDFDSYYLEFDRYDWDGALSSALRYGEGQEADLETISPSMVGLRNDSISPAMMNRPYSISFHGFRGDVEFRMDTQVTSLADNLAAHLVEYQPTDSHSLAILRLSADLLRYGAAAQAVFQTEPEPPILEGLSEAARAAYETYVTKGAPAAEKSNIFYEGNLQDPIFSLSLQSRLQVTVRCSAPNAEQVRLVLWPEGQEDQRQEIPARKQGKLWIAVYTGINASEIRNQYRFVMMDGDSPITNEALWSIQGSLAVSREKYDDPMRELCNAILAYGDSAYNFFNN